MAFSKDLEEIIEAALADGVLTDKERAVLHKKAMQEGVDPDELDVVIEGRLAKMKREVDWLKPAPPASEKRGNIVKCPSCGEPVPGGAAVCPLCGHEFRNVEANKTAVEFAKSLSDLRNKISSYGFIKASDGARELYGFIVNYPIPNTCDDLLEFLTSLQPKAKKGVSLSEDQAYFELYTKCINKAKLNFAQDYRFKPYFDYYDKARKKMGFGLKIVLGFVVLFSLLGIGGWLLSNSSNKDKEQAEAQRTELVSKISQLGSPNEENYDSLRNCLIRINWTGDKSDRMVRDAYNTFFEEKRAYATILNAFYKEHHNGEDDPALTALLTQSTETAEATSDDANDSEMTDEQKIDQQFNKLEAELRNMPEPTEQNYQSLKMQLKKLKWLPITTEAETAKKRFTSPSKAEKYERTKKEAFYELVKAQASALQSFSEDYDSDLLKLEYYGCE